MEGRKEEGKEEKERKEKVKNIPKVLPINTTSSISCTLSLDTLIKREEEIKRLPREAEEEGGEE